MVSGQGFCQILFTCGNEGIVTPSEPIELIAEFGIFFLLFHSELEMDPKEVVEYMWPSIAVAFGGFVLPFIFGFFTCWLFGGSVY